MYLRHLSLTNFRTYARLEIDLPAQAILLYGDNAQGKTSLLEAVYVLATARSPQTISDRQMIHWLAGEETKSPYARLIADVSKANRTQHIEMVLMLEPANTEEGWRFRKQIKLNGAVVRTADLIGQIAVVMFLPDDVEIVSGSPGNRRRYLDNTLSQVDAEYAHALDLYSDVLSQRNALLKQLAESGGDPDQLIYWDEQLATSGALITLHRQTAIAELESIANQLHRDLTRERHTLRLRYQPAFNPDQPTAAIYQKPLGLELPTQSPEATFEQARASFLKQLHAKGPEEMARSTTLVGPHRDELRFIADEIDLGTFGSRGQQRTAVLALKLAEVHWLKDKIGDWPILLLDEVMAELDATRRGFLLNQINGAHQSILTSTDPDMFTEEFRARARILKVIKGRIEE
ncbi:MAG TPA: DNA replication and repair protein RecF [Anaerolineae bacterium]|nr:DNA replication and repair protein RecF [Anaerolineae bacterium]